MRDNTGREIEWCECLATEYTGLVPCYRDQYAGPETKCPDLGDWSEVPHDELDDYRSFGTVQPNWLSFVEVLGKILRNTRSIEVDRQRLITYIED